MPLRHLECSCLKSYDFGSLNIVFSKNNVEGLYISFLVDGVFVLGRIFLISLRGISVN